MAAHKLGRFRGFSVLVLLFAIECSSAAAGSAQIEENTIAAIAFLTETTAGQLNFLFFDLGFYFLDFHDKIPPVL